MTGNKSSDIRSAPALRFPKAESGNLSPKDRTLIFISAFFLVAPIFLVFRGGISLAPRFSNELIGVTVLPLSSFAVAPLLLLSALKVKYIRLSIIAIPSLYTLIIIASLLYGELTGRLETDTQRSILRALQTVFPMGAFLWGAIFLSRWQDGRTQAMVIVSLFKAVSWWLLLFLLLYLVQTAFSGSGSRFTSLADHIGPFYNPKVKRFFPSFLAFASVMFFGLSLVKGETPRRRMIYFFLGMALLVGIGMYWSRTALVAFMTGLIIIFWSIGPSMRKWVWLLICADAALILLLSVGSLNIEVLTSLDRFMNTVLQILGIGGEENFGDSIRLERLTFAFSETFSSPFGSSFQLYSQDLFPIPDIPIAENGFLDIGIRGGIIGMALLIYAILGSFRRFLDWRSIPGMRAVGAAFLSLAFGAMLFLHLATEAYTATCFWFLVGLGFSLKPYPRARNALMI